MTSLCNMPHMCSVIGRFKRRFIPAMYLLYILFCLSGFVFSFFFLSVRLIRAGPVHGANAGYKTDGTNHVQKTRRRKRELYASDAEPQNSIRLRFVDLRREEALQLQPGCVPRSRAILSACTTPSLPKNPGTNSL